MRFQRGMTMVEFALVGAIVLAALIAVLEFGRLMYTYALANEGARRAARLAIVCPVGDALIKKAATFDGMDIAPAGLTADNVTVDYLDDAGAPLANPAQLSAIRQVRVRITDIRFDLLIPFISTQMTLPEFRVTLPRESLGFYAAGQPAPCESP